MTDDAVDYTTMSGAEFQRAVGADPEKWAIAFVQRHRDVARIDHHGMAQWFADAMDAAVKAHSRLPHGE